MICLDRQLPRPRFPAGVSVPSIVCLVCVLLLSVLSLAYLGDSGRGTVPAAVVGSQTKLVASIARGMNASADREADELGDIAERYAKDNAHDPTKTVAAGSGESRWRGIAVLDTRPVSR